VPEVRKVNSLKHNDDFLMHGVVLQNRVFRSPSADVSRETFLRKNGTAVAVRAARCFT
jgi:hypothetical protein